MRKLTVLTLVATHLLWGCGCTAHSTVSQPPGKYMAQPPSPGEPVRVRGVLTKSGEKTEYQGERVALLIGDRVVIYGEATRLLTAERKATRVTSEGDEIVSIRVDDRTYDEVLLVQETPQSLTFLTGDVEPQQEIPLGEIEEVWVEEDGLAGGSKAIVVGLIVLAAMAVATILYYVIGGPP